MGDRDDLVWAYQADQLLEAIWSLVSEDQSERAALSTALVELHNSGEIDVVAAFLGLRRESKNGHDFFLLRHIFEAALPELAAPVRETCRCVASLYREAGTDMAAATILNAFREYCARHPDRTWAALEEIEGAPEDLADLLSSALIAGSKIEPGRSVAEVVRLSSHSNLELRRSALWAIGRPELQAISEDLVAILEQAAQQEEDDQALASIVRSGSEVLEHDTENEPRLLALVAEALSKGGETALHAASWVFGFRTSQISSGLLALLLEHLLRVDTANTGTLNYIDYGVANVLQREEYSGGLSFLEKILMAHPEDLDIGSFDVTARAIKGSPSLRSKVSTRWLLGGKPVLCRAVAAILGSGRKEDCDLQVDTGEISDVEPRRILFVAQKAIGYLFQQPEAATSFLLSLIRRYGSDTELQAELESLLWDPLLINFSGKVGDYLSGRAETEEEPLKSVIRRVLANLENYLEGLGAVGEIPALHPSLGHREAYRRHFTREVAGSYKKSEETSVLLQLVHKSVLLYGRKAVRHLIGSEGEIQRMEIELATHGTEIEFPRLTVIDPHGLDLVLYEFRTERLVP